MEPRDRDLLRAEARFISDYCGESALRRWWERLSAAEQEQLVTAAAPLREAWRRIVEALHELVSTLVDRIAALVRAFTQSLAAALASAWSLITAVQ
jgi:phage-related minor tail protein